MIIRKLEEIECSELREGGAKGVNVKSFMKSGNSSFMEFLSIQPKGSIPYHSHIEEHVIFVLKGKGVIRGENALYVIEPNVFVYIASNEKHSIENPFDETLKFILFTLKSHTSSQESTPG